MNSVRDFVNVAIAVVLMAFIGISLARITFFLLHNYSIL